MALKKYLFIYLLLGLVILALPHLAIAQIGVAKSVTNVTNLGNGQFDIDLSFVVENLGISNLSNVQVVDDLGATFPPPVTFAVQSGPTATGTLTANAGFNGAGDSNLLNDAASTLAIGATGTISLTVRITPNGTSGPFNNSATSSATDLAGQPFTDTSDDGIDPDPDGDGNPDEPGENDPTIINLPILPNFLKTFSPDTIFVGGISTLTFTIDNTVNPFAITTLDFTDSLPAGVAVATPPNDFSTCSGGTMTAVAGTSTISYTGGSVGASATCTLQADVTSSIAGAHVNVSGDLTSSVGNSGPASDTLTVNAVSQVVPIIFMLLMPSPP